MLPPFTEETSQMIRLRRQELLEEAARERLIRSGTAGRRAGQRIRVALGKALVAIGRKLQEPYVVATRREVEAL